MDGDKSFNPVNEFLILSMLWAVELCPYTPPMSQVAPSDGTDLKYSSAEPRSSGQSVLVDFFCRIEAS